MCAQVCLPLEHAHLPPRMNLGLLRQRRQHLVASREPNEQSSRGNLLAASDLHDLGRGRRVVPRIWRELGSLRWAFAVDRGLQSVRGRSAEIARSIAMAHRDRKRPRRND